MHVDAVVARVFEKRAEPLRERMGHDALALDQAGIAERGFLTGPTAVHQHHGTAAHLQMYCDADADNARAKYDSVGLHERDS